MAKQRTECEQHSLWLSEKLDSLSLSLFVRRWVSSVLGRAEDHLRSDWVQTQHTEKTTADRYCRKHSPAPGCYLCCDRACLLLSTSALSPVSRVCAQDRVDGVCGVRAGFWVTLLLATGSSPASAAHSVRVDSACPPPRLVRWEVWSERAQSDLPELACVLPALHSTCLLPPQVSPVLVPRPPAPAPVPSPLPRGLAACRSQQWPCRGSWAAESLVSHRSVP